MHQRIYAVQILQQTIYAHLEIYCNGSGWTVNLLLDGGIMPTLVKKPV